MQIKRKVSARLLQKTWDRVINGSKLRKVRIRGELLCCGRGGWVWSWMATVVYGLVAKVVVGREESEDQRRGIVKGEGRQV